MQSEKNDAESGSGEGNAPPPTLEELEFAHTEMARMCMSGVLQILNAQGHGELNYLKKTFETPQGGVYLLQVQHISGPKIDCQKLTEVL